MGPGGTLLVAGHASFVVWQGEGDDQHDQHDQHGQHGGHDHDVHFPTPDEMLASFELKDGQWRVEVNETVGRVFTDKKGDRGTRSDHVLRLRRLHT